MKFSARVPADLTPNRITAALADLRSRGIFVADLTESNPTLVGLAYPGDLLDPLANRGSLTYEPSPFGLECARTEVAADYRRRGLEVDPARVILTASTSEAYSLLFKLLCDPGDEVLVPRPSYPLFDHLTQLDAVEARPYSLAYHGAWAVDLDSVRGTLTPRTRAIIVVSPNNPTGSFLKEDEIAALARLCADRAIALVGDEVFADYVLDDRRDAPPSVLGQPLALTFGLGGLSKSAGLPQIKLGWMAAAGPARLVEEALARLEIIADAYLSVSTPVQRAAGALIARGAETRDRIRARVTGNHRQLGALIDNHPACTLLPVEGGWSAVVQVPATRSEEALVLALLEQDHVLVHPGYFFDFPSEAFVVLSLLPEPGVFRDGAERILKRAVAAHR
jgi:alanine-synthesizing transaminase